MSHEYCEEILNIMDLSKLTITKVLPFIVYFDYDNEHYFVKDTSEDGDGQTTLFRKTYLNQTGSTFKLEEFLPTVSKSFQECDLIYPAKSGTTAHQVSKKYFVYQLTKAGLIVFSPYSNDILKYNNKRDELRDEICYLKEKLNRIDEEERKFSFDDVNIEDD